MQVVDDRRVHAASSLALVLGLIGQQRGAQPLSTRLSLYRAASDPLDKALLQRDK